MLCSSSPLRTADCANWTPLRFFNVATGSESSGDEFGVLEDDRRIDTGVFQQRHLVHELVLACSPPPPPRPQISYHPGSNSMRVGPPPGSRIHGMGSARELVTIGAWDAALRCAMGLRRGLQQIRSALLGAPVPAGLNSWRPTGHSVCTSAAVCFAPTSLSLQQPFDSNQALVRDFVRVLFPGVQHVMEKEEQLDSRCICVAWTRVALSRATANSRGRTRQSRLCCGKLRWRSREAPGMLVKERSLC